MAQDAMKPPGGQKRSTKSLDTFTITVILTETLNILKT